MNAVIIKYAGPNDDGWFTRADSRAVIQIIGGEKWFSDVPANSGEAETINQDARRIVEKLNAK